MGRWRRDAASGLIVLVPIFVTVAVSLYLYNIIATNPLLKQLIDAEVLWGTQEPTEFLRVLVTIVIFGTLVFIAGYLMRTAFGKLAENRLDTLMNRVPVLRIVYNASKMGVETALGGTENLQQPVKLETWDGIRMTAFQTGQRAEDGRELLFLPTAPIITTGFVIEVEADRFEHTDETVEEALTRIISAGFAESGDDLLDSLEDDPSEPEDP
jgi:uncharacterized membrane protein